VESENIQLTILFEFVSKTKIMFNAAHNKPKTPTRLRLSLLQ
jgi:hypothetical protein